MSYQEEMEIPCAKCFKKFPLKDYAQHKPCFMNVTQAFSTKAEFQNSCSKWLPSRATDGDEPLACASTSTKTIAKLASQASKKKNEDVSLLKKVGELFDESEDEDDQSLTYIKSYLSGGCNDDSTSTHSSEYGDDDKNQEKMEVEYLDADEDIVKKYCIIDMDDSNSKLLIQEARETYKLTTQDLEQKIENASSEEERNQLLNQAQHANKEFLSLVDEIEKADEQKRNVIWTDRKTLEMLHEVKKVMKISKNKKITWSKVQEGLAAKKLYFSIIQMKRKYQELFNKFREIKRHNDTTGNDPKPEFKYYNFFEECCGKQANVIPIYPSSSLNPIPKTPDSKPSGSNKKLKKKAEYDEQESDSSDDMGMKVEEEDENDDPNLPKMKPRVSKKKREKSSDDDNEKLNEIISRKNLKKKKVRKSDNELFEDLMDRWEQKTDKVAESFRLTGTYMVDKMTGAVDKLAQLIVKKSDD